MAAAAAAAAAAMEAGEPPSQAEELEALHHELSSALLGVELDHASLLLGALELVYSIDPADLQLEGPHPPEHVSDDAEDDLEEEEEEDEDVEAFGPDDSFDFYDDVPVRILKQRTWHEDVYYLVQWRACGVSWVAAEDFAYPGVVARFLEHRTGRTRGKLDADPCWSPQPTRTSTTATTYQWGTGNYTPFPSGLTDKNLVDFFQKDFPKGYQITAIERWVNANLQRSFDDAPMGLTVVAFHGTSEANLRSIRHEGLKAGGSNGVPVVHGSAYGTGIYSSKTAVTALGYATNGKVIVCALRIPEIDLWKSVCEYGNIMVVQNPRLLLPFYLIHFQCTFQSPVDPDTRVVPATPTARQQRRLEYLRQYSKRAQKV
eukprot:EG_transcript_11800